jgi:hypothetical protein
MEFKILYYQKVFFICLSGVIFQVILACQSASKTEVNPEASSFSLIESTIFTTKCATPGCHRQGSDPLVLTAGVAYKNLINITVRQSNAVKDGLVQVKPFNAEKSLLYHKLHGNANGHHVSDYGKQMPLYYSPLSENQIEFVRRWIAAGAPESGDIVDKNLLN